jgi:lipoprotein LprG
VRTIVGWRRGVVAAVVATILPAAFVGCSSSKGGGPTPSVSLPAADGLLKASAEAMRKVDSAHFDLAGKGSIAGVEVDSAEGTVTSDGRAQGTVKILQGGSIVELELVVIGKNIYIKGPTGKFAKLPSGAAGQVFDPSQILDPDTGLARLMEFATEGKTVGREDVDGVAAYKVEAQLDGTLVSHLIPLPAVNKVPGTLWISADDHRLVQISVTAPQAGGKTAQLTLHLSDFGVQTDITPPA